MSTLVNRLIFLKELIGIGTIKANTLIHLNILSSTKMNLMTWKWSISENTNQDTMSHIINHSTGHAKRKMNLISYWQDLLEHAIHFNGRKQHANIKTKFAHFSGLKAKTVLKNESKIFFAISYWVEFSFTLHYSIASATNWQNSRKSLIFRF